MTFNIVNEKVIECLLKMYGCHTENDIKYIFKSDYLLDYDIFIKQIIFEIYYEDYTKTSYKKSIASTFEEDNINLASNSDYKKTLRGYKKYREYQDNLSLKFNNGKDVQLKKLNHGKDSFNGHEVYEWQINQLNHLVSDKYAIFKEIVKGSLGDVNKLSNTKLISYLEEYENIFDEIEYEEESFFRRSIHYYQLEIGNRICTAYMIADKLNRANISNKDKKIIMNKLKSLILVNNLENKFIIGLDNYIDYQIDSATNINKDSERVTNEIYSLNYHKYIIRKSILEWINEEKIELNYNDCDELCKNYFGNMQHNCKNKDWNKLIKDFRLFYR